VHEEIHWHAGCRAAEGHDGGAREVLKSPRGGE